MRQLDGLRLVRRLQIGQPLFQPFGLGLRLVKLAFQIIDRLRGISQFALSLLALLASGTNDFGNAALGRFYGLVVQLDSQGGNTLGERLGHAGHLIGNLDRQFGDRNRLRGRLAGQVLIPHLLESARIAAADLLAQSKASDVATNGLQLLAGLDDRFGSKFDGAHGGLLNS